MDGTTERTCTVVVDLDELSRLALVSIKHASNMTMMRVEAGPPLSDEPWSEVRTQLARALELVDKRIELSGE